MQTMNTRHRQRGTWVLAVLAVTAGASLAWATTATQSQAGDPLLPAGAEEHGETATSLLARSEWHELNLHRHGIGLRVEQPGLEALLDRSTPRRVLVVDLGPDVPYLAEDIPPVMAEITVNGQGPLPFEPLMDGVLEARVPGDWLSPWSGNGARILVWGPFGQQLVDFSGEIEGLL